MPDAAKRIGVLYFSNTLARGGAEEHILTLLRGLDRAHFRFHFVCAPAISESLRPDLPADVELLPLLFRSPMQIKAAIALARIIRERKIEILHSHLFYSSLFASPVARICGVRSIIETPHVRESWRSGLFKSGYGVDRVVGRCVDHYIAVSEANARYLRDEKGLPGTKITVIHNGCDIRRYDPAHQPPPGFKRSLGFAEEDLVMVVLGRLEPQKGHRILLEAMPEVLRVIPNARLVCVGTGSLLGELQQQTLRLGLDVAVRWVGHNSNVTDWLSLADMTVLPSFYEGLPLVAIESLAAGRPVIASHVDGTPEVVVHGKTGLTVPPGDVSSLANAICLLLPQPALRHEMGLNGRRWVLEHFTEQKQIQATQNLYMSLERTKANLRARKSTPAPPHPRGATLGGEDLNAITSPAKCDTQPIAWSQVISRQVVSICTAVYGESLSSIVLTGSMARDEATFAHQGGLLRVEGDAEFLLIFLKQPKLPSNIIAGLCATIQQNLLQVGIVCPLTISVVSHHYLQTLQPHILAYELRHCGQVVWGDENILSLIPEFPSSSIPEEDAWRLLCNRIIEQLEVADELISKRCEPSSRLNYLTVKLYLDMATSILVFLGGYEPTYGARAAKLRLETKCNHELPFSLNTLADRVDVCTRWKLNPESYELPTGWVFWEDAVNIAYRLWRWEIIRMTKAGPNDDPMRKIMQAQPSGQILRGWAYVFRQQGWCIDWRKWRRWANLGRVGSPRYCTYAAGCELLFSLGDSNEAGKKAGDPQQKRNQWQDLLPVISKDLEQKNFGTHQLCEEVIWNYKTFLENTRT